MKFYRLEINNKIFIIWTLAQVHCVASDNLWELEGMMVDGHNGQQAQCNGQ